MMKKWFAVMKDHQDEDWGVGSFDQTEAEKMVIKNLDVYPDGYLAVIDGDVCVDEIEQDDFEPVYCYAARIVKAADWAECADDIAHLMHWLDLDEEWAKADGFGAEGVIRKAGEMIGVALV